MKKNSKKNYALKQAVPSRSFDPAEQRLLLLGLISDLRILVKSLEKVNSNPKKINAIRQDIRRAFRGLSVLDSSLFLVMTQSLRGALPTVKNDEEE